jgi:hypothetical protein
VIIRVITFIWSADAGWDEADSFNL